jgi:uncharacterized membrane protein YfcA
MELLRNVVVLLHLIGFAVLFGAWVADGAAKRFRFTPVMNYGLLISFLTGVALAAPWPAGVVLNYPKIGVKLAIVVILGALLGIGLARQRRSDAPVARPVFVSVGVLALAAAGIAVLW